MPKKVAAVHVVWTKINKVWRVKQSGQYADHGAVFFNKKQAIGFGRKLARKTGAELRIHNQDGKISQSDSHGRDDPKIKG